MTIVTAVVLLVLFLAACAGQEPASPIQPAAGGNPLLRPTEEGVNPPLPTPGLVQQAFGTPPAMPTPAPSAVFPTPPSGTNVPTTGGGGTASPSLQATGTLTATTTVTASATSAASPTP